LWDWGSNSGTLLLEAHLQSNPLSFFYLNPGYKIDFAAWTSAHKSIDIHIIWISFIKPIFNM
jgi:hypothetical protein